MHFIAKQCYNFTFVYKHSLVFSRMITKGQLFEGLIGSIGVALILIFKRNSKKYSSITLGLAVSIMWFVIWVLRKYVAEYYNYNENIMKI